MHCTGAQWQIICYRVTGGQFYAAYSPEESALGTHAFAEIQFKVNHLHTQTRACTHAHALYFCCYTRPLWVAVTLANAFSHANVEWKTRKLVLFVIFFVL